MKIIYFILAMLLTTTFSPFFPSWDNWHYSDENCVSYENGYVLINLKNHTTFTMMCNLTKEVEKGSHLEIKFNYSVSPQTILAGIRIIIGNNILISMELKGNGVKDLFLSTQKEYPENSTFTIFIYSLGGGVSVKFIYMSFSLPGKNLDQGLFISGLGISIVFFVLGILSLIMYALRYISGGEKKEVKEEISDEEIAAITGAIATYLYRKNVRIVNVKPSPQWKYGSLRRWRKWRG